VGIYVENVEHAMNIMYLAAGILLLFLGRKSETVILTVSLIGGLLGALLAILLQKFAVGLAGLAAGGYIAFYLLQTITLNVGEYQWLAIAAGALLGAVLAGSMYGWALILLTSASGAVVITENLPLEMPISAVILLGLTIIGIIVQARMKIKE
jgi:hypothetical protein